MKDRLKTEMRERSGPFWTGFAIILAAVWLQIALPQYGTVLKYGEYVIAVATVCWSIIEATLAETVALTFGAICAAAVSVFFGAVGAFVYGYIHG